MCGVMTAGHPMSPEMADIAIGSILKGIRERLEEAASIAKAAEACTEGVEVVLDVEELTYEATILLNGASLINRCAKP